MQINTTQILKNYEGKDIIDGKGKLTLRKVISTAINNLAKDEQPMTAEKKNKAYQISVKLWSKKEINLTVDDLAFIKERVGKIFGPMIYGRTCDIIEGKK